MALCAATGIWREMSSDGRVSPAEVVETFNSMITSAIMNVRLRRDVMPDWREWRKTVAVICVHIDKRLPFFSDEVRYFPSCNWRLKHLSRGIIGTTTIGC